MQEPGHIGDTKILSVGFNERLPLGRTTLFGLQHVLALTGIWLFPALIGSALELQPHEVAWIIQGCFLMTGIITILQSSRILRLPIVQGPTAVFFAAIVAAGATYGLDAVFGSMIVAGVIAALLALPSRRWGLFGYIARIATDPIVFGTLFVIIGTYLASIGLSGWFGESEAAGYGWPFFWISVITVVSVILFSIFGGSTLLGRGAIFWSIILGSTVAAIAGLWALPDVSEASWLGTPQFLPFGFTVEWSVVVLMLLAFFQAGAEAMGMFKLIGSWGGRDVNPAEMNRGLFVEFIGSIFGAAAGGIGTTSYPENAAIVRMSGVGSRYVTITAGIIALIIAFVPKIALLLAGLPNTVLSAASTVLFGIIAVSGIQMLARVEWDNLNVMVSAPAIMIALGTQFLPEDIVAAMPPAVESIATSPLMVGIILLLTLHSIINIGIRPIFEPKFPRPEMRAITEAQRAAYKKGRS